ncbi:HTH-type transcriptional regulator GltC [Nereida ignava]|uniref:HTH-type transcriptional regulator GltC n=1 Tax=Nereida ignava TaxID=282199 RepID=A0A0U1NPV2_9RHOB|nr:LysR family transcriptional regulator [Nereida ignava]CRK76752.1 HTH-type transcriptional regulator GltC [Nereida ignava]SFJ82130.1 DNA-binding transcriptional regulator, LysR family [Nereida ignava DSM 16309]
MNRNNPTFLDFQAVLTLTETQSFRLAAERLDISPSALSRQITNLETRLQSRLFDRDTRNVEVTVAGRAFARVAERMVNTVEDGIAEFESFRSAREGQVTIAGLPSVTASLLPDILSSFSKDHPKINLRIMDGLSGDVLDAVEAGTADIGFTAGTATARTRLSFEPLITDEFVALGLPDGPLEEDRAYPWTDLIQMPQIAMATGTSVRELVDGTCLRSGTTLRPRFEVSHLATAGALVSAGLGITVLPRLTLKVLRTEGLVTREISDFGAERRIGLVRRTGRSLSPAATAFLRYVKVSSER